MEGILNLYSFFPQTNQILMTAALVSSIAACLVNCFAGYKILRFWIFILGFFAGAAIGFALANQFVENLAYAIAASILTGLVLGAIAHHFYNAGVFITIFVMVAAMVLRIPAEGAVLKIVLPLAALVLGVAAGSLSVKLIRPAMILSTAFSGGFSASADIMQILGKQDQLLLFGLGLGLALAGSLVQFLTSKE